MLNNTLTNGNTDLNDPYWLRNGTTRTMIAALTQAAYNTTHAKDAMTRSTERPIKNDLYLMMNMVDFVSERSETFKISTPPFL